MTLSLSHAILTLLIASAAWCRQASKCQVDLLIVMDMSGTQNFNRTALECSREKAEFITTLANRISSQNDVDNFIGLVGFSTSIRAGSSNNFEWTRYRFNHNSTWNSMAGQACGGLTRFVPASRKAIEMMTMRNAQTNALTTIRELVIVSDGRWDDSNDAEWQSLPETARQLGYHITAVMIGGAIEVMGPSSQKNMRALLSENGNKVIWDRNTALSTVSERILAGFENAECLNVNTEDNAVLGGGDECMCPCACTKFSMPTRIATTHSVDYNLDYVDNTPKMPAPRPDTIATPPVVNSDAQIVRPSGYIRR